MANRPDNIIMENAQLLYGSYRNFSGKEGPYNDEGERSFCVIIPEESVEKLVADGWNIRIRQPRNEEEEVLHYLQVKVRFGAMPPKVIMHTMRGISTRLDENSIGELDHQQLRNIDLTIRPYCWTVRGEEGVTAYLKTMHVTIEEDEWESKYASEEYPEER